ncbi:MAG: PAS domain-containing protein, partial [Burkholderiales bacterium]|nr:PAS domain-containing protein [Burkholderiales bacterium]
MPTIEQALPSTEQLENRLEFETLITDLSTRFINLAPDEVDREIENALRRVCEPLGIDLAVLWQWSRVAPDLIMPTHVYHAQDVPRPSEAMREDQYPWSVRQVLAGRMVAISSPEELPAEASIDRATCALYGIKSALCIPLSMGGAPSVGALGFNALRSHREWPDALVQRLQLIAQMFTGALAREHQEVSLQQSKARLVAAAELAGLGFYEVDFGAGAIFVDDRLRDICGIPPDRRGGLQALEFWIDHLHPDDRASVLHKREQLHSGELSKLILEYRYLHPACGEKWIHHISVINDRDAAGRVAVTFGVLRDVTERKRVENEMRSLSRRLIQAHEDERALLARELHDDVTQRLAVLAIEVGRAELAAPDTAHAGAMRSLGAELVRLSEDIHSLAYQLHPSVLEELGLIEALRAECERRGRQGQLDLSLDLEPLPAIVEKEAELCLFRVAQEALNNVARHAGTRSASVTLRQMDGGLVLAVRDAGTGFDPEHPREPGHLGLASMRERVQLVNGTLDIESAPGLGTTLVVWVPAR